MRSLLFIAFLIILAGCGNSSESTEISANDSIAKEAVANDPVTNNGSGAVSGTKPNEKTYIHHFGTTKHEVEITNDLLKLPFVLKTDSYIDSLTEHRRGISFMLDSAASNENEISVQAGYNGPERFETYYRFFVNPKTREIKVYDPVSDKKLSVKQYLKTLK